MTNVLSTSIPHTRNPYSFWLYIYINKCCSENVLRLWIFSHDRNKFIFGVSHFTRQWERHHLFRRFATKTSNWMKQLKNYCWLGLGNTPYFDLVHEYHSAFCLCYIHSTTFVSDDLYLTSTVYPKEYAHGFVVLCVVVVMQSFIMNSHEVFIHIHQGCFAGTGAIVRLPQCQWSKPDGYRKISQCITTTKHSKAKTVCIFLGIYCSSSAEPIISYFHIP